LASGKAIRIVSLRENAVEPEASVGHGRVPCGEERIVGLLEPIIGVGVAAEMRIAQVELRCPRQSREFVPRLDIPCSSVDPPIDRVVSLQRDLAVEPDIRVEFEERTREITGIDVQAVAVAVDAGRIPPIDHLLCENRGTPGRIGEVRLVGIGRLRVTIVQ
jgi:hypothetical protein